MADQKGSWVKVGRKRESDIYVNLDTGEKKHIGTEITSNKPKVYDGDPSLPGYIAGKIAKKLLGRN